MHPPCDCPQHPVEKSQTFAVKMLTNTFYTRGGRGSCRDRDSKIRSSVKLACIYSAQTPGLGALPHLLSKYSGLKRIAGPKHIRQQRCKLNFKSWLLHQIRSESDTILSYSSALYLWWNWWVWCPLLPLHSLQTQYWSHSGLDQTPSPAASPEYGGI